MAISVWPVDAVAGEPMYDGRDLRQPMSATLAGATAARPLGAMSGVRIGTPDSTVALSGFGWTVKPHSGILDLQIAAEASAYWYAIDANETGTVAAAHATYARIDLLTVRLDDPSESDGSSVPAVVVEYVPGTAAASPVAPATPARSMVLATIGVPASGGGNPTSTFIAPFCAPAGAVIPVRNQAGLDAIPGTYAGMMAYRHDNATTYRHNGTTWEVMFSRASTTLVFTAGASAYNAEARKESERVFLDGAVSLTGISASTWTTVCTLPAGFRPAKYQYYPAQVPNSAVTGYLRIQTTGAIEINISGTSSAVMTLTGVNFRAA